jgi:CubicO group peptidase (beta-lactamase class C family)
MTRSTPLVRPGREALRALLDAAVAEGVIPGGVALVGTADDAWEPVAVGVRRYGGAPADPQTRYDLASLTKVVGGLPALLRLLDAGEIALSDPVRRFFSNAGWFQTPSLADVTVEDLALHRAGLPAWTPLFALTSERRTAVAQVLQSPLSEPAGRFLYSDLGVIALGAIVERVSGERLDAFLEREVFAPLGMRDTGYGPLDASLPVAATEDDGLRGGVLEGVVHDENAWALDGVSAHAGLFGTARDLLAYGRAWLGGAPPFASEAWRVEALRDRSDGEGPRRGLLWRLFEPGWMFGERVSPAAFGHTGFTGTSLVVDPGRGWVSVLLTNRVHPSRERGQGIAELRRAVHDAVAEAFGAEGGA